MTNAESNPYDEIRYPGYAYAQTHPDHLAALATVYGLAAAPPEHCRVLEVGCGDGGNLLPMAWGLPESRFVGIELAHGPLADARTMAARLGLENVELHELDLRDATAALGTFDYVIAHGFYSWVPDDARTKLFELCGRVLAPNGIAFVSYRAQPGSSLRQIVREMMLYHLAGATDPRARLGQARALLDFVAAGTAESETYGAVIRREAEMLGRYDVSHFFHDDLAPICDSFWFHEFIARAAQSGLQFLSEADFESPGELPFPEETREVLRRLDDQRLAREQYLDFLRGRRFRQTLLCRQEAQIENAPVAGYLRRLRAASSARPESGRCDPAAEGEVTFKTLENRTLGVTHSHSKAALLHLGECWPHSLSFDELLDAVSARLGGRRDDDDARLLGELLLAGWSLGAVDVRTCEPRFTLTPGPRPLVSALTRLQIELGRPVSNMRHEPVLARSVLEGPLLQLCDGTRDRAALARELAAVRAKIPVPAGGVDGPETDEGAAEIDIDAMLDSLAHRALLLE